MSCSGNTISGNYIGTDITGRQALGNSDAGIRLDSVVSDTTIGGRTAGGRNLVSGNGLNGVTFVADAAGRPRNNRVIGNFIGVDVTGELPLSNTESGIAVVTGDDNEIGGETPGDGNLIAHNGDRGVAIHNDSTGNLLRSNRIHSNGALGIDLDFEDDGVTLNDAQDPDAGPNGLQNYPVLSAVDATTTPDVTVSGNLDSTPLTSFRLEFFASRTCDPAGHGEGERALGTADVVTANDGTVSFDVPLPVATADGEVITATATAPDSSTSEFSACQEAVCLSRVAFGEQIVATSDKSALTWPTPSDVRHTRGPLAGISSYTTSSTGWMLQADSMAIAGDHPAAGEGLYYLVMPLGCGSWQTALSEEPDRDSLLP